MKIIDKNFIEFSVDLGFNKFDSLKNFFGINEETGELKFCKYNHKTGIATFSTKLLPWVYDYMKSINENTKELLSLKNLVTDKSCIDVSKQDFLRDEQWEFMKKISSRPFGIIQLHTGYGKNVMISYIEKHFTGKGNILVMAPAKSILEEIEARAKEFGVKINPNKIRSLHAAGFMNSKNITDKDWLDFLENVELILVDESENVPSTMNSLITKYCKNHKYIYGFSATADRYNNKMLSYKNLGTSIKNLHPETASLMYYFGTMLVYKSATKVVNILQAYLPLPPEPTLFPWQQKQAVPIAVENVIKSPALTKYFNYIRTESKNRIIFIPVKTKDQGYYLLDYMEKANIRAVFWSGDGIDSTKNIKKLKIKTYTSDLKPAANDHKLDVIIGTKVAFKGIDIKAITDILLVIGTDASVVNQIIGRAYRAEEDIRLWLLYNANDRYVDWDKPKEMSTQIYNRCCAKRMTQIRNAQKSYTLKTIDIRYPLDNQPKNIDKIVGEETVSKREQHMDESHRESVRALDMIRKSFKHKGS